MLSVYRPPHLTVHWWKFVGEPLHDSQGIIYHMFKNIRAECREFDSGQPFFINVKSAFTEVTEHLKKLALNYNGESIVAPLQRQSTTLSNQINKALDDAQAQVTERDEKLAKLNADCDLEIDDEDEVAQNNVPREVLEEEVDKLNAKINDLYKRVEDLLKDLTNHSENTKYGHYILLRKGLITFEAALKKYLKDKCKRPRGFLEFVLNNAIELFSGQFMAEHSGFEQTNKNAMASKL